MFPTSFQLLGELVLEFRGRSLALLAEDLGDGHPFAAHDLDVEVEKGAAQLRSRERGTDRGSSPRRAGRRESRAASTDQPPSRAAMCER